MKYPSYTDLYRKGELKKRSALLNELLNTCELCPHRCRVNRIKGELGLCSAGAKARVFSYQPHFGEEPVISGKHGSGTIFFSHCSSRCIYCQNWRFSQNGEGEEVSVERLAQIMLELQAQGCHNINLVTPTHYLAQIIKALEIAVESGLNIPLIYNTSGYERVAVLKLLDGIIDIYLPDMRYGSDEAALKYSNMADYTRINQKAIKEMYRQAGNLQLKNGIAVRGLIIRHLILPHNISETDKIMSFISREISKECFISLMSQYYPFYKAHNEPSLNRPITQREYEEAFKTMSDSGLQNGWVQEDVDEAIREKFAGEYFKQL